MFTPGVGRIGQGWGLAKQSLVVVREDGSLVALTILGGISAGAIGLALLIPAVVVNHDGNHGIAILLGALGAYLATATGVFFAVALASCAADVLDGKDATVAGGVRVATSRLHVILAWALVLTTVNLVIQALRERGGLLGAILGGAANVAWSVATFLVIPILALEGLGPLDALKRSTSLFRQRWGEQLVGRAAVGLVFFVLAVLPAMLLVAIGVGAGSKGLGVALVVIGVLVGVAGIVLGQTASSVFAVALYRYAAGEGPTGPFGPDDLQGSVVTR